MITGRSAGTVGRTRVCPHCKATILESAPICPQCRHHLRFGAPAVVQPAGGQPALRVEGTVQPAAGEGDLEYSVVVTIRNERGQELSRHVVGVGAMRTSESRTFTLSVEVLPPGGRAR